MKKIHIYDDVYIQLQRPSRFVAIFVTVCVLICIFSLTTLHLVKKQYESRMEEIRYEIVKESARSEYYKVDEDDINSVSFMEKIARQELGYVGKDDIIFKVIDKAQLNEDEPAE